MRRDGRVSLAAEKQHPCSHRKGRAHGRWMRGSITAWVGAIACACPARLCVAAGRATTVSHTDGPQRAQPSSLANTGSSPHRPIVSHWRGLWSSQGTLDWRRAPRWSWITLLGGPAAVHTAKDMGDEDALASCTLLKSPGPWKQWSPSTAAHASGPYSVQYGHTCVLRMHPRQSNHASFIQRRHHCPGVQPCFNPFTPFQPVWFVRPLRGVCRPVVCGGCAVRFVGPSVASQAGLGWAGPDGHAPWTHTKYLYMMRPNPVAVPAGSSSLRGGVFLGLESYHPMTISVSANSTLSLWWGSTYTLRHD